MEPTPTGRDFESIRSGDRLHSNPKGNKILLPQGTGRKESSREH